MKEKILKTLALFEEGHTIDEIQNLLNIDNKDFNNILKTIKNSGFNLNRTYYSDGRIFLKVNKTLNFNPKKTIRINVVGRIFKAIFISDLHIGSKFESLESLKKVYQYAEEHDCHVVFNGGDLIENIYPDAPYELKDKTLEAQVKKVLRAYPYNPNILSFILYGNHDYRSLTEYGFDISRYLEEKRYDLISLGYGESFIRLKDDAIAITHDLKGPQEETLNNVAMLFRGHSHKSKTRDGKIIYIPALTKNESTSYEYDPLTSFLDVEFIFFEKKIARINLKQLAIINSRIRLANEQTMLLNPNFVDNISNQNHTKKKLIDKN